MQSTSYLYWQIFIENPISEFLIKYYIVATEMEDYLIFFWLLFYWEKGKPPMTWVTPNGKPIKRISSFQFYLDSILRKSQTRWNSFRWEFWLIEAVVIPYSDQFTAIRQNLFVLPIIGFWFVFCGFLQLLTNVRT